MAIFDEIRNKASELVDKAGDKVDELKTQAGQVGANAEDLLKSEKLESASDAVLDKVAGLAKGVLGDSHAEKIDSIRDSIDDKIGPNDAAPGQQ